MITVGHPPEQMMFQLSLRRRGISDRSVLRAMEAVPRDQFVAATDREHAWQDTALAIACGQTISQPFVVAYMTEQLQAQPEHRVLEIGTGSGYQAAILSKLARDVLSIERYRTLADSARARLERLDLHNVEVMLGDGAQGWNDAGKDTGPYDVIVISGSLPVLPPAFLAQLKVGGRMFVVVGDAPAMAAQIITRASDVGYDTTNLFETVIKPLHAVLERSHFTF